MSRAGIIGLHVVIALIAANTTMNAYIRNVFNNFGSLKSMNKLIDDMNISYKKEETQNIDLFPICVKSLSLKTRDKVINYQDICIKENQKYFLRGKNGVGKSIFLSAIQGIINLDHGSIKYNIHNRNNLNTLSISSKMICLKHDPLIFKGSILENLFISEDKWNDLSKEFHFLTKNFSDCNYDATLLSLGEKQMIALLRSLISNKELIIIDEVLAAVSKKTRKELKIIWII